MSRCAPTRRVVGDAIGRSAKTVDVTLICTACPKGTSQIVPFVLTEPFAKQAKAESCLWCGRLGAMKQKGVAA